MHQTDPTWRESSQADLIQHFFLKVTLVSDDAYWSWWKLSTDGSYQLMLVVNWWKLSTDGSYRLMEVIHWCKLSTDGSYQLMEVINWWKLFTDWLADSLTLITSRKKVVWCKNVLLAPLCDLIADQRMYIISMELTVDIQHLT